MYVPDAVIINLRFKIVVSPPPPPSNYVVSCGISSGFTNNGRNTGRIEKEVQQKGQSYRQGTEIAEEE
jgi:hypothetical protein